MQLGPIVPQGLWHLAPSWRGFACTRFAPSPNRTRSAARYCERLLRDDSTSRVIIARTANRWEAQASAMSEAIPGGGGPTARPRPFAVAAMPNTNDRLPIDR